MREGLAELNQVMCEIMSVKVVVGGEENNVKGNSRVQSCSLWQWKDRPGAAPADGRVGGVCSQN